MGKSSPLAVGVLVLLAGAGPAVAGVYVHEGGPAYLSVGAGTFNAFDHGRQSPMLNLEYQSAARLFGIGAAWGILANTDGAVAGYGGVYSDIGFGRHWVLTPTLGFGGYDPSDSKDLGSIFVFRLELALAYQFDSGTRLGLKIAHISNAGTHPFNPGEDEIMLVCSLPIRWGETSGS